MMKAFAKTDVGKKRKINQDFIYSSLLPVGNLPNLFIVADGMGGHKAGDLASRLAVETLVEEIQLNAEHDLVEVVTEAISAANQILFQKAKESENLKGMGTTLVISVIKDSYIYTANVGDSRLYLIGGEMTQITEDHSLVEEMVRIGEIKKEEARKHPDRNIITRAIGVNAKVEPDVFHTPIAEGDLILMCTDGLTNMIEDDEIKAILKSGRDLPEKVEMLVHQANENGGTDNISVILIEPKSGEVNVC